jgi:nicotinamide-nucleotide amidase
MPSVEIIAIGTEILLGEIVDTNTRYIARTLRGLGVDMYRTNTIGDNASRIAEAIQASMARADIVITTGGLGPTVDDPTRQAVAEAFGVELEYREELWQQVVERMSQYGRPPGGENQRRQAHVPKGAIAIENPVGTAPCFIMETERNVVISLPGVPREMEYLLHEAVIPYLQKRYDLSQVIKVRLLHVAGTGESTIDEKIGDLELLANPTVGLAAHSGVVDVRIAAKAKTEQEADQLIADVEAQVRQRLETTIFGADDETLEGITLAAIARRGWKLSSVEAGLDGGLNRKLSAAGNPAYLGGASADGTSGTWQTVVATQRQESGAEACLGVRLNLDGERPSADLCLITPDRERSRHMTYGGHPKNAQRWAINHAINWLRRVIAFGWKNAET